MELEFFDKALLYNKYPSSEDRRIDREDMFGLFEKSLNNYPKGMVLRGELLKTPEEDIIVKEVRERVEREMSLLGRNKIIKLPDSLIHIVTAEEKINPSCFLKGIAVERGDINLFKARLYYKLFNRLCESVVVTDRERKILLLDDGLNVLKEGLAAYKTREYVQEFAPESLADMAVDVSSEGIFMSYLEEYRTSSGLGQEESLSRFSESIINGTAFLLIALSRGFDPNESVVILNWIRMRESYCG